MGTILSTGSPYIGTVNIACDGGYIFDSSSTNMSVEYNLTQLKKEAPLLAVKIEEGLKNEQLKEIAEELLQQIINLKKAPIQEKEPVLQKVVNVTKSLVKIGAGAALEHYVPELLSNLIPYLHQLTQIPSDVISKMFGT